MGDHLGAHQLIPVEQTCQNPATTRRTKAVRWKRGALGVSGQVQNIRAFGWAVDRSQFLRRTYVVGGRQELDAKFRDCVFNTVKPSSSRDHTPTQ